MSVPRVVVVGDGGRTDVAEAIEASRPGIARHAHLVAVDLDETLDLATAQADVLVLFGGDGALLSVARRLNGNPIPVVGVNFGKIGFLAEFRYSEFVEDFARVVAGECPIRRRALLSAEHRRGEAVLFHSLAFNDVVISRGHFSRIIQLAVRLDGQYVTRYQVDGLIVATPTGSTAHSLAAGGPIVHPDLSGLILTPICPHAIAVRPLIVPGDRTVTITLTDKSDTVAVTFDGQIHRTLELGDCVAVREAAAALLLVESGRRTYFQTLEQKLGWRGYSTDLPTGERPASPAAGEPACGSSGAAAAQAESGS